MSEADIEEKSNTHHSCKPIVILGGVFAGIGVLKNLQKEFHNDRSVEITLVSKDSFLLFSLHLCFPK
jgi:NADH dehydrogenase